MLANEVFAWLSQQPAWQRDLARRLMVQISLDEAEYGEALLMIKGAHRVPTEGSAPEPKPIERTDMTVGTAADPVQLLGLGSMQGVGLVADDAQLSFGGEGATIIYGGNGTGKSSYVKALKKLCRTVDFDCVIRSSVFEAATPSPSAKIRTSEGGQVREQRTPLTGDAILSLPGMSVFDSACAELYVDKHNTIQYVPAELRLLARLAALQDQMRSELAEEHARLKATRPPLDVYATTTRVHQVLGDLRGTNSDPDLAVLATLSDEETVRRDQLRAAVAAAAASTSAADAAAAEQDARNIELLVGRLGSLADRVGTDELEALHTAVELHGQAQEAVKLAAEQLRGPIEGIGSDAWKLLWEAARTFVVGAGRPFPTPAGDHCPLCLQPVEDATAMRLAHFEEHIESEVTATATKRAAEHDAALARVAPARADELRADPFLGALRQRELQLAATVDAAIDEIGARLRVISADPAAAQADSDVTELSAVTEATGALVQWAATRAAHAATLRAADDAAMLPSMKDELAELDARQQLFQDLPQWNAWRSTLLVLQALDETHSALATSRITTAQRELMENEIAKALDKALAAELTQLGCRLPVRLLARTARAETSVAVELQADNPPPVSAIASEGEQRALALAFFLAELEVANDLGGIIVDDPVSSLDDDRRVYIARRLITEARSRQVIVFTHDLPLVFELKAAAKDADIPVSYQCVWRQGETVGRVDDDPPFKTLNLTKRINKLDTELQHIKNNPAPTLDAAWSQVDGFYSRLRTCWERAVEERIFGGVVQRFERDVKTKQFGEMRVTPELLRQIDEGMTRASRFVHEDSYRAQVALASVTDMAEDLDRLRQFDRDWRAASPLL